MLVEEDRPKGDQGRRCGGTSSIWVPLVPRSTNSRHEALHPDIQATCQANDRSDAGLAFGALEP